MPEWRPTTAPRQYNCGQVRMWDLSCRAAAEQMPTMMTRTLQFGPGIDANSTFRRLHDHAVLVLGDSTSVQLWCALTCGLLNAGAEMASSAHATGLSRALNSSFVTMTHAPTGVRLAWMLPHCGGDKPHCWHGHSVHSRRHCGGEVFEALHRAGGFSRVRLGSTRLVVLFSPCTAHYNSPLLESTVLAWQHTSWAQLMARNASCLDAPVECANCEPPAPESASNRVAGAASCSTRAGLRAVAAAAKAKAEEQLRGILREAVHTLRTLGLLGHLAILVGSTPTHFPQVLMAEEARDALYGGYDRAVLSPLLALVQRVRASWHRVQAFGEGATRVSEAAPLLDALQVKPNAAVVPWKGLHGGKSYAWLVQGALAIERQCAAAADAAECWQRHMHVHPSLEARFSAWRLRLCEPPTEAPTLSARGRAAHGLDFDALKARLEMEAAAAHGVPLLDRYAARLPLWDVHPGASHAERPEEASFDCLHSTLTPGAWDVELHAFGQLVRRHAGGALPEPADPRLWLAHKASAATRAFGQMRSSWASRFGG